tara:strand:+ start:79 stop:309 length:231 start_codon:yes stop_codon:yes gene_type:complete
MKDPKKRGAGLAATEPHIKNLTGRNLNSLIELLQVCSIKPANLHSSVKDWDKPHWLTLEFEEYVSKTRHNRKEARK